MCSLCGKRSGCNRERFNRDNLRSFHLCRGVSEGRAALYYGASAYVRAPGRRLFGVSLSLSHCLRVFSRALAVFRELGFVAPLTPLGGAQWGSPFRMVRRGMRRGGPVSSSAKFILAPTFFQSVLLGITSVCFVTERSYDCKARLHYITLWVFPLVRPRYDTYRELSLEEPA